MLKKKAMGVAHISFLLSFVRETVMMDKSMKEQCY